MKNKTKKKESSKKDILADKIKELPKNIKEVLMLLIKENIIEVNKINKKGDFEKNIQQQIEESFKDKLQYINEEFSELRKGGKDLGILNFKLMIIPLKIKVFLSTYEKKDAENLLSRIKEIEKEIYLIKR